MARNNFNQNNFAAERLHDFAPDYFLTSVVAAFYQDSRLHTFDQLFRRVLIEYSDQVNRFKRGQNFGPRLHRLDGTAGAFKARHGRITIEAYNETIASCTRASQQFDVAGVQQIKAAVGKPDTQTLLPPFSEVVVEDRPIENNCLFRRQRRRR
jgi:hypothetical protein